MVRYMSASLEVIFVKIVVNDVLNNLSMMVVTSFRSSGPCNKEIIEYDLEENIKYKFINIKFLFFSYFKQSLQDRAQGSPQQSQWW